MPQSPTGPPATFGYNDLGQLLSGTNNIGYLLTFILGALQQIQANGGTGGGSSSSNLPYGADEQVLTNVVGGPGPTVIVYKKAGTPVKTRTLTYTGSGPNDVLISTKDT